MHSDACILIVDDLQENIDLLERMLRRVGYTRVHTTTDPRNTVDLFDKVEPDLVVLDLEMPHMSGLEVMVELWSAVPDRDRVPVLILTGTSDPQAEWRCLALGARDFVRKPFRGAELLLRVDNLLEWRALNAMPADPVVGTEEDIPVRPSVSPPSGAASIGTQDGEGSVTRIAHELNNLLTRISGYADLLLMDAPDNGASADDAAEIRVAAQQAATLVMELGQLESSVSRERHGDVVQTPATKRSPASVGSDSA